MEIMGASAQKNVAHILNQLWRRLVGKVVISCR